MESQVPVYSTGLSGVTHPSKQEVDCLQGSTLTRCYNVPENTHPAHILITQPLSDTPAVKVKIQHQDGRASSFCTLDQRGEDAVKARNSLTGVVSTSTGGVVSPGDIRHHTAANREVDQKVLLCFPPVLVVGNSTVNTDGLLESQSVQNREDISKFVKNWTTVVDRDIADVKTKLQNVKERLQKRPKIGPELVHPERYLSTECAEEGSVIPLQVNENKVYSYCVRHAETDVHSEQDVTVVKDEPGLSNSDTDTAEETETVLRTEEAGTCDRTVSKMKLEDVRTGPQEKSKLTGDCLHDSRCISIKCEETGADTLVTLNSNRRHHSTDTCMPDDDRDCKRGFTVVKTEPGVGDSDTDTADKTETLRRSREADTSNRAKKGSTLMTGRDTLSQSSSGIDMAVEREESEVCSGEDLTAGREDCASSPASVARVETYENCNTVKPAMVPNSSDAFQCTKDNEPMDLRTELNFSEIKDTQTSAVDCPTNPESVKEGGAQCLQGDDSVKPGQSKKDVFLCFTTDKLYGYLIEENTERKFQCKNCKMILSSMEDARQHVNSHSPFKCASCDIIFSTIGDMKIHHRTEHKERLHCNYCMYRTSQKSDFKRHVRSTHKQSGVKTKDNKIVCYVCGMLLYVWDALDAHMEKEHGIKHGLMEGDFQCPLCSSIFRSDSMFRTHMMKHEGNYHHCSHQDCNFKCIKKSAMAIHEAVVHAGYRAMSCTVEGCETKFINITKLNIHLNVVHYKVRKFFCEKCGKGFLAKYHLQVHERIHSDIKPVGCKYCDYRCRQTAALKWHMKKTHPEHVPSSECVSSASTFLRMKPGRKGSGPTAQRQVQCGKIQMKGKCAKKRNLCSVTDDDSSYHGSSPQYSDWEDSDNQAKASRIGLQHPKDEQDLLERVSDGPVKRSSRKKRKTLRAVAYSRSLMEENSSESEI